jgi:hypothetical protein
MAPARPRTALNFNRQRDPRESEVKTPAAITEFVFPHRIQHLRPAMKIKAFFAFAQSFRDLIWH